MHPTLTYPEAIIVGLFQGVTELFPVSSLGHSVLIPALVGGSWKADLDVTAAQSPYLAFIVGMHVATAIAMIIYFWRDWLRIVKGFFGSFGQITSPAPGTGRFDLRDTDQRLAWMIILGTIPVGLAGVALDHTVRTVFAKPIPTAIFLAINGLILFFGEFMRRRRAGLDAQEAVGGRQVTPVTGTAGYGSAAGPGHAPGYGSAAESYAGREAYGNRDPYGSGDQYGSAGYRNGDPYRAGSQQGGGDYGGSQSGPGGRHAGRHASGQRAAKQQEADLAVRSDQRITRLGWRSATALGACQILALFPGISRDGSVMVAGLVRGLSRQDAARFSFLLSAPVIFAAGVFKASELLGPETAGIRGQILVGSVISGIGAYLALRFLDKYLSNPKRTLTPFAVYCLVMGIGSAIYLGIG
jgi:undecaprenyl-diphosphatase